MLWPFFTLSLRASDSVQIVIKECSAIHSGPVNARASCLSKVVLNICTFRLTTERLYMSPREMDVPLRGFLRSVGITYVQYGADLQKDRQRIVASGWYASSPIMRPITSAGLLKIVYEAHNLVANT